jgi:hypothetical protein
LSVTNKHFQQFRDAVYQSLLKRPDAVLDMIDALTIARHVESPVTLSEQTPFRRKFSMVYDTLSHAVIDLDALIANPIPLAAITHPTKDQNTLPIAGSLHK